MDLGLTWFGDADANLSSRQVVSTKSQGSLQAIQCAELDITKTFGFTIHLVFHDPNIGDLALSKELADIVLCCIEG
jgi:hypothetical protein